MISAGSAAQPAFKSLQRGTVSVTTGATGTATISAVTMAKARVRFLGVSTTATTADNNGAFECRIALSDATTVTLTRGLTTNIGVVTVSFEVEDTL